MKKKKQIKVIISFLVMIAVLLGGWGLMKQERLSAADRIAISPESTKTDDCGSKPQPPTALLPGQDIEVPKDFPGNLNVLDLKDGFHIVKLSNAEINDPYCQKNAQIFNPSLIDPLNYPIKDGYDWKNTVQMVQPYQQQRGAIWYEDAILLNKDFAGEFEFFLGNIDFITNPLFEGVRMADGITFTLQNDSLNAIGSSSWGMGVSGFSEGSPLNQGFVKNALSIQIRSDKGSSRKSGNISVGFPQEVGLMSRYNMILGDTKGNITDGSWAKVEYLWDHEEEIFKYRLVLLENQTNHFGPNAGLWQEINFKEATATSRQYEQDSTGNYATTMTETTNNVLELRAGGTLAGAPLGASGYFNGDKVYWGFTGATSSALTDKNGLDPVQPLNPIVSIGQTPNQSQSPLQLSMEKFGEIGSDEKRQPLAGAKFILQKQDEKTKNWQQVIPDGVSDLKDLVFTTDDSGKIIVSAFNEHGALQKTQQKLIENITANNADYRFREVAVPNAGSYVQPPTIPDEDPANFDYSGEEPEHSATLFSTEAKSLNGNSTTTTEENDGDFGAVYNNTPPTIELTKSGVASELLSGVEMTIGARVTDQSDQQKVMSLAQLSNSVKNTTLTEAQMKLITDDGGKISVPENQLAMMMDLASSSLDVYKSLDQWVFIETKAVDTYKPSPFSVSDGTFSAQDVLDTYKNKFIFDITDNWTSGNTVSSKYEKTANNDLNQFTITPEAVGPKNETLSEAGFEINGEAIATSYPLAIGNGETATLYNLTQTQTNEGYDVTSPIDFKLIQDAADLNKFTVIVDTENPSRTDVEFYYLDNNEQKVAISPNSPFTSSDFLDNPNLYVQVKNSGNIVLGNIEPLKFGNHTLPFSGMNAIYRADKTDAWSIPYTDNRSEAEKNDNSLYLYAQLESDFTYYEKDENDEDAAVDSIANILRFKDTDTAVKEITTTAPELIKTFKTATPNPLSWTGDEGFFLDVKNAYYEGRISPSNVNKEYKAVLLLTIANDALPPTEPPTNQ